MQPLCFECVSRLIAVVQIMANLSTALHTSAKAGVKTCLDVCVDELEHQNLIFIFGHFLGRVNKSYVVLILYLSCLCRNKWSFNGGTVKI